MQQIRSEPPISTYIASISGFYYIQLHILVFDNYFYYFKPVHLLTTTFLEQLSVSFDNSDQICQLNCIQCSFAIVLVAFLDRYLLLQFLIIAYTHSSNTTLKYNHFYLTIICQVLDLKNRCQRTNKRATKMKYLQSFKGKTRTDIIRIEKKKNRKIK